MEGAMGVLSDRINTISFDHGTAMKSCLAKNVRPYREGFEDAMLQAATIAAEADKIMKAMAEALHCYSEDDEGASPALDALLKYHKWKERTK